MKTFQEFNANFDNDLAWLCEVYDQAKALQIRGSSEWKDIAPKHNLWIANLNRTVGAILREVATKQAERKTTLAVDEWLGAKETLYKVEQDGRILFLKLKIGKFVREVYEGLADKTLTNDTNKVINGSQLFTQLYFDFDSNGEPVKESREELDAIMSM